MYSNYFLNDIEANIIWPFNKINYGLVLVRNFFFFIDKYKLESSKFITLN